MEQLGAVLRGRDDVVFEARVVASYSDAVQLDFHGSPTVLIDGRDPSPSPREPIGLTCRIYDTGRGTRGWPTRAYLATISRLAS